MEAQLENDLKKVSSIHSAAGDDIEIELVTDEAESTRLIVRATTIVHAAVRAALGLAFKGTPLP